MAFKMRSGNGPLKFKNMGSSPMKHPIERDHSHGEDGETVYTDEEKKKEEKITTSEVSSDDKGYQEWKANLPKNLQTETEDYNLRGAYEGGLTPVWDEGSQSYHLSSVNPKTGEWLKSMDHPSAWMEYQQHSLSMDPYHREHTVTVNPEGRFGEKQLKYVKKNDK